MEAKQLEREMKERGFVSVASDVQAAYFATIGMTRRSFYAHVALLTIVVPVASWVAYVSPLASMIDHALAVSDTLPPLSFVLFMLIRAAFWGCAVLPPLSLVALTIFTVSGAFGPNFWDRVERVRSLDIPKGNKLT